MDISKIFDEIDIQIYESIEGPRYFDPIRNMFLHMTPEELVRQKMIVYLSTVLKVPVTEIFVEDHLIHYGVENQNGRIDISILENGEKPLAIVECKEPKVSIAGAQVFLQAAGYADAIKARYIILVNGLEILFYKRDGNDFVPLHGVLTYEQMVGKEGKVEEKEKFQRLTLQQYKDIQYLKSQEWYYGKIGEDTSIDKIPVIMNLDDCLLDYTHKLKGKISKNLEVLEDFGNIFMNYGNASGEAFGTGYYRMFLINNTSCNKQFVAGLSIQATRKTVNDSKFGNRDGLTVLVVCRNDGEFDETSVQINLNKFLSSDGHKATLTHNAAVTRKGASKLAAMDYIGKKNSELIKSGRVLVGEIDCRDYLYIDNSDVKKLIGNIIEYSVYRDEYKHSL